MFRVTGGINCALYQNLHQMKIIINIREMLKKEMLYVKIIHFSFLNDKLDKC